MEFLGKIFVRNFKPKTAKRGKEITVRKKALQKAFVDQNKNLGDLQEKCKGKNLSIKVVFYLNKNTPDKSSFKKDLDNLLKILMDVIKEEMDDSEKKIGLGLIVRNEDEVVFNIDCHKEFVSSDEEEGIDLEVFKWDG